MRLYLRNRSLSFILLTVLACLSLMPQPSQATPTCTTNPCVTQIYAGGGDPSRTINIVYVNWNVPDAPFYAAWTENSARFLTRIAPYNLYSSYFNIYRVNNNSSSSDTPDSIKAFALSQPGLPNVTRWVFMGNTAVSYSSYGGDVFLVNTTDYPITAHEMGHSIGYLGDEYIYAPNCPSGVYTGGEPIERNLTINTNRSSLKWNHWLGIGGIDLYPSGKYCSSGIYHPSGHNLMLDAQTPPYTFDPVSTEQLIWGINDALQNPFVSYAPSSKNLTASSVIRLTVQPDPIFTPQGGSLEIRWWVTTPSGFPLPTIPVPGATSTSFDFDPSIINVGETATVWARAVDPDVNNYVRNENLVNPTFYQGTLTAGGLGASWNITRQAPPPLPTITYFSPPSGLAGTIVTITGTNFTGTTAVKFKNSPAQFSVISTTQIQATVPYGATTGTIKVTTSNGTATSSWTFTVIPSPPTINYISPASAAEGNSVYIYGSNFCVGSCAFTQLTLNGTPITPDALISLLAQFTVPPGATTGNLAITTSAGTDSRTFTVIPPPVITSFDPAGRPGVTVSILGTGFCNQPCNTTSIKFNGVAVTSVQWIQDNYIRVVVPAGATTGPITVQKTPGGTATSAGNFVVLQPPTITSFTPIAAPVGTSVTINGTHFCGFPCQAIQTQLKLNGAPIPLSAVFDNYIFFTLPADATTGQFTITTHGGSTTSVQTFTVTP